MHRPNQHTTTTTENPTFTASTCLPCNSNIIMYDIQCWIWWDTEMIAFWVSMLILYLYLIPEQRLRNKYRGIRVLRIWLRYRLVLISISMLLLVLMVWLGLMISGIDLRLWISFKWILVLVHFKLVAKLIIFYVAMIV